MIYTYHNTSTSADDSASCLASAVASELVLERIVDDGFQIQARLGDDDAMGHMVPDSTRPQNIEDFLGDFFGCIHGSGANNSEYTGKKFASSLVPHAPARHT